MTIMDLKGNSQQEEIKKAGSMVESFVEKKSINLAEAFFGDLIKRTNNFEIIFNFCLKKIFWKTPFQGFKPGLSLWKSPSIQINHKDSSYIFPKNKKN